MGQPEFVLWIIDKRLRTSGSEPGGDIGDYMPGIGPFEVTSQISRLVFWKTSYLMDLPGR